MQRAGAGSGNGHVPGAMILSEPLGTTAARAPSTGVVKTSEEGHRLPDITAEGRGLH